MSSAPTVTFTTEPPSAHVVFTAATLSASAASITAYRIVDGVEQTVRTAINLYAVGGAVFDDAEVAVGAASTYRAEQFDAHGTSLGFTDATTITVPSDGAMYAWISDPLDSTTAIQVVLGELAGSTANRSTPGTLHKIGMKTIALVGYQGLLEALNMDFYTESFADRDAVLGLLQQSGGLILIRTAAPIMVPRLLYCWASKSAPSGMDLWSGSEAVAWANVVDEVSPTEGGIVKGATTWQTYLNAFPTWTNFNAAYLTWFDALTTPPVTP